MTQNYPTVFAVTQLVQSQCACAFYTSKHARFPSKVIFVSVCSFLFLELVKMSSTKFNKEIRVAEIFEFYQASLFHIAIVLRFKYSNWLYLFSVINTHVMDKHCFNNTNYKMN